MPLSHAPIVPRSHASSADPAVLRSAVVDLEPDGSIDGPVALLGRVPGVVRRLLAELLSSRALG